MARSRGSRAVLQDIGRLVERVRACTPESPTTPCARCGPAPGDGQLELLAATGNVTWRRCPGCEALYADWEESEWMGFYRDEVSVRSRTTPETMRAALEHACDRGQDISIWPPPAP